MKINIRPLILILSGLHVLFLFFPIFPIRSGWGIENKSVFNFIVGVDPGVLTGDLFMVGRGLSICTALIVIGIFILCLSSKNDIERNIPFYVVAQIICMCFWIAVMVESYLNTSGVSSALRSSFGIPGRYEASLFWPKFVLALDGLNIAAFISLASSRFTIENISFNGIQGNSQGEYHTDKSSLWICKKCNASNDLSNIYCCHCGAEKEKNIPQDTKHNSNDGGTEDEIIAVLYNNVMSENQLLILNKSLIKRDSNRNIYVENEFRNITNNTITALLVDVTGYDPFGNTTDKIEGFRYLDLKVEDKRLFGKGTRIILGSGNARSAKLAIRGIVYENGESWEGKEETWVDNIFEFGFKLSDHIDHIESLSNCRQIVNYLDTLECFSDDFAEERKKIEDMCYVEKMYGVKKDEVIKYLKKHFGDDLDEKKEPKTLESVEETAENPTVIDDTESGDNSIVFCHKCGTQGESGGYCRRCGAKLLF